MHVLQNLEYVHQSAGGGERLQEELWGGGRNGEERDKGPGKGGGRRLPEGPGGGGGERLSEGPGQGQGARVRGRRRRGEVQRSRQGWREVAGTGSKGGGSEGADFCKFAGTVNRYGGSCGRLVEAFGNSRGFDRQAFFRRHLAFRRPGEFYGCLLCRSIEGVEV